MKLISFLLAAGLLVFVISGCDWGMNTSDNNEIRYYTKEVELSRYIDDYLQPVESLIYDEDGKLSVIFKYFYADPDSLGYSVNDKTEIYEVDEAGVLVLVEYYLYEYQIDYYEYEDDDGVIQTDGRDYILKKGETYDPGNDLSDPGDDILVLYYDVTYKLPLSDIYYDEYETIIDHEAAPKKEIARQESTYTIDGYRTEKFYNLADSDAASVTLVKEFACWYDADEPWDYLYELYHSIRGTTLDESTPDPDDVIDDEIYYFTTYSRNDNGDIYEQADFIYDKTASPSAVPPIPAIPIDPDGSFTVIPADPVDPFDYKIYFEKIGAKATVLNTEYDSLGNIIKDKRYLNGHLSEYTTYTYNSNSELTDQSRYTSGGSLLYDRISIQYRDEYRDEGENELVYYRVKEKCTFKYYKDEFFDPDSAKALQTADIQNKKQKNYRKVNNNHR